MKRFSKEFKNFTLEGNDHLMLTLVETHGNDLSDFISNATISLETWHGNEGPDWTFGDLSSSDYDYIVQLFTEYLAGA